MFDSDGNYEKKRRVYNKSKYGNLVMTSSGAGLGT